MKLFIVESPGKVKKNQDFLGSEYKVMASIGHVRDLPLKEMGVKAPNFTPTYEVNADKKETVNKLLAAAKNAQEVFLATDPDREGEAIAWHLKDLLKLENPKRVTYNEITEKAVKEGVKQARAIDMHLVFAQEGRRVLDRLCGYMVSNPLSQVAGDKLSAGRVQSPAIRLIVERDRAIKNFHSTTHYGVEITFDAAEHISKGWKASWLSKPWLKADEEYILDQALATQISKIGMLEVVKCEEAESRIAPPAPFITLSLLQAASVALKFTSKKTTALAQTLYELGVITYIRTDFPNLSPEFVTEARTYCESKGWELVAKPRSWKSKEGAQEAHEAIRPTHIEVESVSDKPDEQALYNLIRQRTLASQLADAVFAVRKVQLKADLDGKEVLFEATGRTLISLGWKIVISSDQTVDEDENDTETDNPVPALKTGQTLKVIDSKLQTKKTAPPARYSDASLFKELEKRGIGRPSTYSAIFENILGRDYVRLEKRKLASTKKGELIVDNLQGNFSFIDYEFTTKMEADFDKIASAKTNYKSVVSGVFDQLETELRKFNKDNGLTATCPACSSENLRHLVKKAIKKDDPSYDYFSCPDCKASFFTDDGKPGAKKEKSAPMVLSEFKCLECKKALARKQGTSKNGAYDFFGCSGYPKCTASYKVKDDKPDFDGKK